MSLAWTPVFGGAVFRGIDASAEVTRELTGQEIGGVTIFGLPDGLPVWLDSRITDCEQSLSGPGPERPVKIKCDLGQRGG